MALPFRLRRKAGSECGSGMSRGAAWSLITQDIDG
jgi:hypothetical protein